MKLFAFVVRRRARRPPTPTTASDDPAPAVAQEAAAGGGSGAPSEKLHRRPSSRSAAWKPTLVAISEDAAVTSVVAVAKPPAGKAKARPPSPRAARSSYHDFRYTAPAMTMLPAFTPTAFLF